MSPTEDSAYALPPELVKAAREAEAELRKSIGRAPREYVTHGSGPSLVFSNEGNKIIVSRNDIVDFLGPLVRIDMSATKEREGEPKPKREVSFASVAGNKVLEFIEVQFYELRALICKKNKTSFPSKTVIALSGITDLLMKHFGLESVFAGTTAVSILVAILTATKGAFCKMTDAQAKAVFARYK